MIIRDISRSLALLVTYLLANRREMLMQTRLTALFSDSINRLSVGGENIGTLNYSIAQRRLVQHAESHAPSRAGPLTATNSSNANATNMIPFNIPFTLRAST